MWAVIIILVVLCLTLIASLIKEHARVKTFRQSDEMKTLFIDALAREIRTPLHSVSGLAEIISKEDLYLSKEEKKNISDQILYNARLIDTVLDEVSLFSDEGGNVRTMKNERFSPNRVCMTCIDANLASANPGVKIVFHRGVGDELFISAERHIVELVLSKLINISCRFTKKGEITVGCRFDEIHRLLTYIVEDTGGGIPEERKDALFKWFDDPSLASDIVEFDLSVSYRLAQKIGGNLHWDSTYTKGTRMEFVFPVR